MTYQTNILLFHSKSKSQRSDNTNTRLKTKVNNFVINANQYFFFKKQETTSHRRKKEENVQRIKTPKGRGEKENQKTKQDSKAISIKENAK